MTKSSRPWWRAELGLGCTVLTVVLFLLFGNQWLAKDASTVVMVICFAWLFAMIMWGAITVVRHADALATRMGEPYGTLVLTMASISIEVFTVISVMVAGKENSTMARDTMYAVLIIVLNGLIGGAILLGGLRHREQEVNIAGARSYLAVLVTLAVLGLILPNYTVAGAGATLSNGQAGLLASGALMLYGIFLWIQTARHREYFTQETRADGTRTPFAKTVEVENVPTRGHSPAPYPTWVHAVLLVGTLFPILALCKKLAVVLNYGIENTRAPEELGGLIIALLVMAPEGLGALKSAWNNEMQRSVNILLGSALSTIGLTIPAVLFSSLYVNQALVLGLAPREMVMLALTLFVSLITFSGRRTNVLLGAVHLVIFATYVVLIFDQAPT